jgi:hypothetical protein
MEPAHWLEPTDSNSGMLRLPDWDSGMLRLPDWDADFVPRAHPPLPLQAASAGSHGALYAHPLPAPAPGVGATQPHAWSAAVLAQAAVVAGAQVDAAHAAAGGHNAGSRIPNLVPVSQPSGGGGRQTCSLCQERRGSTKAGNKISADGAIAIFRARSPYARTARHPTLSNDLARQYGISAKAVRDIWKLRTWWNITKPFWNAEDHEEFRGKLKSSGLCARCRDNWLGGAAVAQTAAGAMTPQALAAGTRHSTGHPELVMSAQTSTTVSYPAEQQSLISTTSMSVVSTIPCPQMAGQQPFISRTLPMSSDSAHLSSSAGHGGSRQVLQHGEDLGRVIYGGFSNDLSGLGLPGQTQRAVTQEINKTSCFGLPGPAVPNIPNWDGPHSYS